MLDAMLIFGAYAVLSAVAVAVFVFIDIRYFGAAGLDPDSRAVRWFSRKEQP